MKPQLKIAWLVREAFAREITGVALKDESGGGTAPANRDQPNPV